MPVIIKIDIPDAARMAQSFRNYPVKWPQVVEANFKVLGVKVTRIMQRVMEPVKYKGTLARSVQSEIDVMAATLTVGPTAKEAPWVFYGTRPHWAPIAPLKEWARWKLGDEKAAYAIQNSIKWFGTNIYYVQKQLPGWWKSKSGIGLDYLKLTTQRGDFKTAVRNTGRRLVANWVS